MRDHSTVLTRRALLAIAAAALAAGTIAPPLASGYDCCSFDNELNLHALDCPACLALTCTDCEAGPGEECHFGCSSYWR